MQKEGGKERGRGKEASKGEKLGEGGKKGEGGRGREILMLFNEKSRLLLK